MGLTIDKRIELYLLIEEKMRETLPNNGIEHIKRFKLHRSEFSDAQIINIARAHNAITKDELVKV